MALKRVAGNRRLYRDLLGQFADEARRCSRADFSRTRRAETSKLAERIAHTVKGVAGNIGITEVQSAAQKLEKAIREGHDSVPALLDEFASLLGTQVHAIKQALRDISSLLSRRKRRCRLSMEKRQSGRESRGSGPCWRPATVMPKRRFAVCRMQWQERSRNRNWMLSSASINDFDFEAALLKLDEIAERCTQTEEQAK